MTPPKLSWNHHIHGVKYLPPSPKFFFLKIPKGFGEMIQQLGALGSLSKPRFSSQHSHGGSQSSVASVSGVLVSSSDLACTSHACGTHM